MTIEDTLKKLVGFQTVTGNAHEIDRAYDWIEREAIADLPLVSNRITYNGHTNLLITPKNNQKPDVWLYSHIDVVPGDVKLFSPVIKGSMMCGRGVFDMKFALACYLVLFRELAAKLNRINAGIMIVSDEETGGFNGVKKLIEDGFTGKVAVVPDAGNNFELETRSKGVLHLHVATSGESAHGAHIWEGKNAIQTLISFLTSLERCFSGCSNCDGGEHWHRTLNIGTIKGGTAVNSVPESAEAQVDIRFTDADDRQDIEKTLSELCAKYPEVTLETLVESSSTSVDMEHEHIQNFTRIMEEELGRKTTPTLSHGASDARHFVENGVSTIVTQPNGGGHHSDEEWIDLSHVNKFYGILSRYVQTVKV